MIKTILNVALASALVFTSYSASAVDATVVARASSDLVYRGVELSPSDLSLGLSTKFDNVVVDGLYVSGNFDTVEVTPLNDNTTVRSDVEVGYGNEWNGVEYSVSLARVLNPINYSEDYTELRGRVGYGWVYSEVGYGLSNDVNQDLYVGVGVESQVVNTNLTVGALASVVYYDTFNTSNTEFNNVQLYGSYPVLQNLDVTAGYSFGGDTDVAQLDDHGWVGVSYTF